MIDAPGPFEQMRHREARQLERDGHVEVEGGFELLDGRLEEGPPLVAATGVVHEDVETAELANGAVDDVGQDAKVVHVGRAREGTPAGRFDLGCHALDLLGRAGDDRDRRTGFGEAARDRLTDAATASGDQRDATYEREGGHLRDAQM